STCTSIRTGGISGHAPHAVVALDARRVTAASAGLLGVVPHRRRRPGVPQAMGHVLGSHEGDGGTKEPRAESPPWRLRRAAHPYVMKPVPAPTSPGSSPRSGT